MVACAKYLGREVTTCTRGENNCICKTKLQKIQEAIGAHDWPSYGTFELSENIENLVVKFVNQETQECADICKEIYENYGITCAEEIEDRLILKGQL